MFFIFGKENSEREWEDSAALAGSHHVDFQIVIVRTVKL
jgi:hypothetical protein